ncbi:MAG: TIGR04282 family arsenosugar biosynthesis glycosyltransferase [Burkholderiaceae bacterium]
MNPCLLIAAKQPERGKVKTRIASVLGDDQAAELCRCALHDVLSMAASIRNVKHALTYAPPTEEARRYFERIAPAFELLPQQGATLGERLSGAVAHLMQRYRPLVLIGSDSPDLSPAFIERTFALLRDEADVVLGPADDGGYYLLGLALPQPALFEEISWSTEAVAQQTRQRAREARLRLEELPRWHDLDTVDDLHVLVEPGAPLTRAFVATLNTKVKQ